MLSRPAALIFGIAHLISAAALTFGVSVLPARWAPVDAVATALTAFEVLAAVGLLGGTRWAARVAAIVSAVALVCGLGVVTSLALTASWLSGVYGPVGQGGAVILTLVALMVIPYFVALPAIQLAWLGTRARAP